MQCRGSSYRILAILGTDVVENVESSEYLVNITSLPSLTDRYSSFGRQIEIDTNTMMYNYEHPFKQSTESLMYSPTIFCQLPEEVLLSELSLTMSLVISRSSYFFNIDKK